MPRRLLSALMLAAIAAAPASAAPSEVETAYLDLVFGNCFQRVFGQTARETSLDPAADWEAVEDFRGSEASMNSAEAKNSVDLRAWQSDSGDLLIDLAREEMCWTQASAPDPGTIAARVRTFAVDHPAGGVVLNDVLEQSESGATSRVVAIGMTKWSPDTVPILIIREILNPRTPSITVQVVPGARQEEAGE